MLDELEPEDDAAEEDAGVADDDVADAAGADVDEEVVVLELEPQPAMAIEPTTSAPVMSRRRVLPVSTVSIQWSFQ
jgi:hypothetical protein